jgi:hypothetical protein
MWSVGGPTKRWGNNFKMYFLKIDEKMGIGCKRSSTVPSAQTKDYQGYVI